MIRNIVKAIKAKIILILVKMHTDMKNKSLK